MTDDEYAGLAAQIERRRESMMRWHLGGAVCGLLSISVSFVSVLWRDGPLQLIGACMLVGLCACFWQAGRELKRSGTLAQQHFKETLRRINALGRRLDESPAPDRPHLVDVAWQYPGRRH